MSLPIWDGRTPVITFRSPCSVVVGVSSHPSMTSSPVGTERGMTLANQILLLQELGVMILRIDYRWDWEEEDVQDVGFLSVCMQLAEAGIKILPIVGSHSDKESFFENYTTSDESLQLLYKFAFALGARIATKYDAYTYNHNYEIANELDVYAVEGDVNWKYGDKPTDYSHIKILKSYWYLKGLDEGIKSVVSSAKTLVDFGYYGHVGFLKFLCNPTWMGVSFSGLAPINYDISAWHPYFSNSAGTAYDCNPVIELADGHSVLAELKAIGKPIALTEFNREGGSKNESDVDQVDKIDRWMKDMVMNGGVKIDYFIYYSLFDDSLNSSYYGVLDESGKKKPVFYSLKNLFDWLKNTHTNV